LFSHQGHFFFTNSFSCKKKKEDGCKRFLRERDLCLLNPTLYPIGAKEPWGRYGFTLPYIFFQLSIAASSYSCI
jgi:hypothetical protein